MTGRHLIATVSGVNEVSTAASLVIALLALVFSVVSTKHASRAARAAEAAARSAEMSARAEERAVVIEQQRFEREQLELERLAGAETSAREAAERQARSAHLELHTTRTVREVPPTFGDPETYDYWLVVANAGPAVAERVRIANFACNGYGEQDMPAHARDPSQLSPGVSLLARRSWEIHLVKTSPRNTYDLAHADVAWSDGNGENCVRLAIDRRW
jgi:hypothetical protein